MKSLKRALTGIIFIAPIISSAQGWLTEPEQQKLPAGTKAVRIDDLEFVENVDGKPQVRRGRAQLNLTEFKSLGLAVIDYPEFAVYPFSSATRSGLPIQIYGLALGPWTESQHQMCRYLGYSTAATQETIYKTFSHYRHEFVQIDASASRARFVLGTALSDDRPLSMKYVQRLVCVK